MCKSFFFRFLNYRCPRFWLVSCQSSVILKARVWSKDSKGRSRTDVHGWSQQFAAPFTY